MRPKISPKCFWLFLTLLFLLSLWRFDLFGAEGSSTGSVSDKANRPNIFFFFADDWGRYASIYEDDPINTVFTTPAFDRVATEGVRFNNAHVNSPSCTPCRSALFSGQHFYRTGLGAFLHAKGWDSSIPTYPILLEKAGYHTGLTYKGWSPGSPRDAPLGGKDKLYDARGGQMTRFSQNATRLVRDGKTVAEAKRTIFDECLGNFDDFLAARKPGEPFCYLFGPRNTHRTWEKGSGKALWNLEPEELKGKLPKFLPDVPEIREDVADYLGEVLALDAVFGMFLEKLDEMGELDNTIIVVSGDHGIPGFPRGKANLYDLGTSVPLFIRWGKNIPHGRAIDDFVSLIDLAPTFLELAGEPVPECMTGRSLAPLLFSEKSGQIDPTRDHVITGQERHFVLAREGNLGYPMRSIQTNDFLYIRNFYPERNPQGDFARLLNPSTFPSHEELVTKTEAAFGDIDAGAMKAWVVENYFNPEWKTLIDYAVGLRPSEELYDLRIDPDYLTNVADNREYAQAKQRLSERLLQTLRKTNDPRMEADSPFDHPPYIDPSRDLDF